MIRRNPTLIPMSDGDVQDVRDMVAKELETMQNRQVIMKKVQSLTEGPDMFGEGDEVFRQLLSFEMKTKRLGLEPGVSNNIFEKVRI